MAGLAGAYLLARWLEIDHIWPFSIAAFNYARYVIRNGPSRMVRDNLVDTQIYSNELKSVAQANPYGFNNYSQGTGRPDYSWVLDRRNHFKSYDPYYEQHVPMSFTPL